LPDDDRPDDERIVALGLLTQKQLTTWAHDLKHIYPVPSDGNFDDLLRELDRVSKGLRR
jgi:hypothetical protein